MTSIVQIIIGTMLGIFVLTLIVYLVSVVQMVAWIRTFNFVVKLNKEKQNEKQV